MNDLWVTGRSILGNPHIVHHFWPPMFRTWKSGWSVTSNQWWKSPLTLVCIAECTCMTSYFGRRQCITVTIAHGLNADTPWTRLQVACLAFAFAHTAPFEETTGHSNLKASEFVENGGSPQNESLLFDCFHNPSNDTRMNQPWDYPDGFPVIFQRKSWARAGDLSWHGIGLRQEILAFWWWTSSNIFLKWTLLRKVWFDNVW